MSEKYSGKNHAGGDNSSPYPVSRLSPQVELVNLAQEIAQADNTLTVTLNARLQVIADQIRALQNEAHEVPGHL